MAIHSIQSNFLGGEVSPHLYTRVDSPLYPSWLKKACNFLIHPQGGASNRPGTAYVQNTKYDNHKCRLIPFVLSEDEAYVLEVGHQYIRIHTQAGTLLQDGNIFEVSTPYRESELSHIHYVQYGQELYITHSSYAPRKLIKLNTGYFALQEVAIVDGPFMLANTDTSKKMRVVSVSDTVVSSGVKASLSFLPVSYPNYFIQAYWRGDHFYDPSGYGFNVAEVVQYFNARYSSTGCVAYNQGGVLRIESPQATGGNYNDSELTIYYYSSLLSEPKLIVTQRMSGGQNAGEVISSGEAKLYLDADFDAFRPGHEGALWALHHRVESSYQTGTLGYSGISNTIQTGGDWSLRTTGTWYGEIVLESSEDQVTWEKVKHFTKAENEGNISMVGNLAPSAKMHYLRVRCLGIAGEMGYVLQAEAFDQEGIVKLLHYVDARRMQVSIQRHLGDSGWTYDWAEGAFSQDAGFPGCVFFYQDRLGLAGTKREPQSIWFSKTGEYNDFGYNRTLIDSDAISITLSSNKLNAINSVVVGGKLLVFTAGSEWSVGSNSALTPYNIEVAQEGERGASSVAPVVVGNRALYVQARGGILRDFYYEYSSDSYTGRDLTLRAKHLFFNREITQMSYQQEPDNLVWCILDDGALLSLTYLAEENVFAWTQHQTQGSFVSVCTIPAKGYDATWFVVQRNGKYYVERLLPRLTSKKPEEQIFLDCSLSKKNLQPFSTMSGLSHLEGMTISALADGSPLTGLTVQNGVLTLPKAVYTLHVGLPYQAQLQTLPVAMEWTDGTSQDRKRRMVQVMLKVLDSRGGEMGITDGKLDELVYTASSHYNEPASLESKEIRQMLCSSHSYFPSITVQQSAPLPLSIVAVLSQVV
ncbi:MAG: hypothetical protein IKN49_03545 [Elusimicrobiaceae bacterium]|nr:hypothetical protein [Elusimicrobiaceae bacterium]